MSAEDIMRGRPDPDAAYFPKISIGGVSFCKIDDPELLTVIERSVASRRSICVAHPNVHHINVARKNDEFRAVLARFDYLVPDGIGVYLAAKFLYGLNGGFSQRQNGTDFYSDFLERANENHWKVFFLGDRAEVLESLKESIGRQYPGIVIAGTHNGFFPIEDPSVAEEIRKSVADVLMIGRGVPRQELWLQRYKDSIDVSACLVVGGGISFMAGAKRRAPSWMRVVGLEWLYRMNLEPKRLWSRYLFGIPSFFIYVIKLKLGLP